MPCAFLPTWAVTPAGLHLSVVVALLGLLGAWLGYSGYRSVEKDGMRLAMPISVGLLFLLTGCVTAPKDEPDSSTPHDLTDVEKHRIKFKTPDALFSPVRAVVPGPAR